MSKNIELTDEFMEDLKALGYSPNGRVVRAKYVKKRGNSDCACCRGTVKSGTCALALTIRGKRGLHTDYICDVCVEAVAISEEAVIPSEDPELDVQMHRVSRLRKMALKRSESLDTEEGSAAALSYLKTIGEAPDDSVLSEPHLYIPPEHKRVFDEMNDKSERIASNLTTMFITGIRQPDDIADRVALKEFQAKLRRRNRWIAGVVIVALVVLILKSGVVVTFR